MPISTLLDPASDFFAFDHDQLHRQMLAAELDTGALTPLLEPIIGGNVPAGNWNSDHAQAHQDFATAFSAITWPSTAPIADINLSTGPTEWWAFQNRNLHNIALSV